MLFLKYIPDKYLKEVMQFLNTSSNYETKIIGKFISKKDKNIIVSNE